MPTGPFKTLLMQYDDSGAMTVGQVGRTRISVTTGYQERVVLYMVLPGLDLDALDMRYAILRAGLRHMQSLAQLLETERRVIAQTPPGPP